EWMNDAVRADVVKVLAKEDPDEALALADALGDPWQQELAKLAVVDALDADQRARKLELLAAVRAGARQVEQPPGRLVLLGHVAEPLLDGGERETARPILDEGLALAKTLPPEEWSGFARGNFAEELAQVDLAPALELVAPLDADEKNRHRGNIAHEL